MRKGLTCARDGGKTHSVWRVFHGQKLVCAPAFRALTEIIVTAKDSWWRMLPLPLGTGDEPGLLVAANEVIEQRCNFQLG